MSNPIPGWYPDPEEPSRQRFWDGSQWTEARAYPLAAGPDGEPVAATPESAGSGLNWRLVALLALLAAAVLAAAYFFLLRGDSSAPEPVPTLSPTAVPSVPTGPTAKPTVPTAPPTQPPVTPTVPPVSPTLLPSP